MFKRLEFAPDAPAPKDPHDLDMTGSEHVGYTYEEMERVAVAIASMDSLTVEAVMEAAAAAHAVVDAELEYSPYGGHDPNGAARQSRSTNCLGLGSALSAVLQSAGVDHEVGFTAGHAYLNIPVGESNVFVDTIEPTLTSVISSPEVEDVPDVLGRTVTIVPAAHVHARFSASEESTSRYSGGLQHPWSRVRVPVRSRLLPNEDGRKALQSFNRVRKEVLDGDLATAQQLIAATGNSLPEADADPRLNAIIQAMLQRVQTIGSQPTALARADAEKMLGAAEAYLNTLPEDGFREQAKGDIIRPLAAVSKRKVWNMKAIAAYRQAKELPGGSYIDQKMGKTLQAIQAK